MTSTAAGVDGLSKRFRLYRERNQSFKTALLQGRRAAYQEHWALQDVSFEVPSGSTFGLVGDNGSGKSTLLKCLARILVPDRGSVHVQGRVAALLELGSGFHPELTGRENVLLNGTILGMKQREVERRFDDIVAFADVASAIDQPIKTYSSGMYARLGFAIATSVDPDVLLVDEVLAVGDAAFQRRCMDRIQELRKQGRTVVLVSHAAETVRLLCDDAAWLRDGKLVGVGPAAEVMDRYARASVEERSEVAGDDSRWGNGDVEITAVDLLVDSSEVAAVDTGSAVELRVRWRVVRPVDELVVGLGLTTWDGTHLWGANTGLAHVRLDGRTAEGEAVLRIPRLALQPGRYALDVSAHDLTEAHTYDYRRRVRMFEVTPGDARESGGALSLGGTWHTS